MAFSIPTVDQIKASVPSVADVQAAIPASVSAAVASFVPGLASSSRALLPISRTRTFVSRC